MGLSMPLSCIKLPYSFRDYEVTNFSLFGTSFFSSPFCPGILQHVLWVFSILDILRPEHSWIALTTLHTVSDTLGLLY
jgi:hypothetical protein